MGLVIGVLLLTVIMLFVSATRWIVTLDRALNDRELPGRNADEIAPWREKGRTLTNEWRHLLQHGAVSPYQRAEHEADEWRIDMRRRLEVGGNPRSVGCSTGQDRQGPRPDDPAVAAPAGG